MTVQVDHLEAFLLILVRITAFIYVAPFFNLKNVPRKVKAGFSFFFALVLYEVVPMPELVYQGVIGFAGLLISEALVGIILGFFTNICYYILAFAGQMMDMEIGFAMVNEFDPVSNIQTTITSNYYSYIVMLIMMVTNLHHYLIIAFADAFKIIPLGGAKFSPSLYLLMIEFIKEYFIIGFRIILPVFAATLILNVILAILAKVAPQMNMFVIGIQLKIFVGLAVLFLVVGLTPRVAEFIFDEMIYMMRSAIDGLR
ncbi:flagellar biosynthetic protein FliR [Anaerocolumna aminovalerica]|jgi:flagellar biosynthetic protein FliR|uniref:Flagellar biosynthetic protein FliR n=1 Tax=Anaerocolumna aminovalerica TaxID=1527 RepID=A0A1I5I4K9_9FIRM|nr:flagellar biosynthetic protein FliR [Anaerocolumna aminovalerica]MBU5333380.1 flagellar biosynthetic protein FliR [Anaerocolumna aminovalerica]MDU6263862.1 flagellar biosynthetic protein FliR [Anaerocolumna aminovalerica]SFO55534.1 flagellar biosynthetic protein FliR [Anaerocolumna aminovalerica]